MSVFFLTEPVEAESNLWILTIGGNMVGVCQNGYWCKQLATGQTINFDTEENCLYLSPVLEMNRAEFFRNLECLALKNPSYSNTIRGFPTEKLLKFTLRAPCSGYWPQLALEWLSGDQQLQGLVKNELELFALMKAMPQISRQLAKKMLKAI